jgi:hypothetical protein
MSIFTGVVKISQASMFSLFAYELFLTKIYNCSISSNPGLTKFRASGNVISVLFLISARLTRISRISSSRSGFSFNTTAQEAISLSTDTSAILADLKIKPIHDSLVVHAPM